MMEGLFFLLWMLIEYMCGHRINNVRMMIVLIQIKNATHNSGGVF
ncbi:conserved hypothetical protein [Listeria monocytogenes]|nr:conserved hypothetical protein [Listeria monocytogenes]CUK38936.1 conserved hypothetical protein [Listeria monocytogenes]CUK42061.1 conserved hypothetical protein [Listeria monocytogenes]CUK46752.1 conserved hypothetical protein [Listeria monocytogenes]CUK53276.1 conserved hypothetical protein [Listeria monocytogenes]